MFTPIAEAIDQHLQDQSVSDVPIENLRHCLNHQYGLMLVVAAEFTASYIAVLSPRAPELPREERITLLSSLALAHAMNDDPKSAEVTMNSATMLAKVLTPTHNQAQNLLINHEGEQIRYIIRAAAGS